MYHLSVKICTGYTQYPIIRNGLIRNSAEFLGKFKKRALGRSNLRNASNNLRNGQRSDFQTKETSNIFQLYLISNFSLSFILEWLTLSVELKFTTNAVFLAKLADFSCSIYMAYVVMASYFWKNLRND